VNRRSVQICTVSNWQGQRADLGQLRPNSAQVNAGATFDTERPLGSLPSAELAPQSRDKDVPELAQ
jgi:hypothetical protein